MGKRSERADETGGQATDGLPYRWLIAGLASWLLLVATISPNTFGVFFKPISEQFGWSRGVVSGAYALRSIVAAILVAPAGYWSDRYGPRGILTASFLALGAGFILLGRVTAVWQLYLAQGVVIGMGAAAPFACLGSTVGKWHGKTRVMALSVFAAGGGLTTVLFPPIAQWLILKRAGRKRQPCWAC